MTKTFLHKAHNQNTSWRKIIQLFIGAPNGHAAFMTSLRLDASLTLTPRVLHHCHPAAPDAPPILRSTPVNLLASGFETQTGKPTNSDIDACPTSPKLRCLQVFRAPAALAAY
jgi:hypothetical protein